MDSLFLSNAEDKENSLMHQSYLLDEEQKVSLTNFSHCTNSTNAMSPPQEKFANENEQNSQ